MNKYRDKSDFEINKAVTEELGEQFTTNGKIIFVEADVPSGIVPYSVFFDPCNNPADAMPITIENGISMIKSSGGWICCHGAAGVIEHENLYRAAMEVFLMMKDAENEK
ncbi:phage protein NinX family protein [Morganella morganii]|uniref:phage protein NinX family protein n=1 Tax=Morganella morganii TaxID=582 RepID=UPI000BD2A261|nr:phage protein NinX family protein [Morganella morganii]PCO26476.1 recombinase [Morganella morganii]